MNKDDFYKNLVSLFKLFRNRPHHLAKYLTDNDVFTTEFINNIINSEKLNNLSKNPFSYDLRDEMNSNYFISFNEMNEWYDNILINDEENFNIEEECNIKLLKLLEEENFEEAIKLRDYMKKNGINIKH